MSPKVEQKKNSSSLHNFDCSIQYSVITVTFSPYRKFILDFIFTLSIK